MNATELAPKDALHFICAFAVSGQYAPEVRCLIYPLLLLMWVPGISSGALTTILSYCGVAAIHIAAMATHHSKDVLDLDLFPAVYVCVLALILTPAAIMQSKTLRDDSIFAVFILFVILLWIGVVSFAGTAVHHPAPQLCSNCKRTNYHKTTITNQETKVTDMFVTHLATGPVNANRTDQIGNCISKCSTYALPLRSGQNPQNVIYPTFFYDHKNKITIIVTVLTSLWLWYAFANSRGPTRSELLKKKLDAKVKKNPNLKYNSFGMRTAARDSAKATGFRIKATVLLAFFWTLAGESMLKKLPYSEKSDAIGQWGPIVAFFLVMVATLVQLIAQDKIERLESQIEAADEVAPPAGPGEGLKDKPTLSDNNEVKNDGSKQGEDKENGDIGLTPLSQVVTK